MRISNSEDFIKIKASDSKAAYPAAGSWQKGIISKTIVVFAALIFMSRLSFPQVKIVEPKQKHPASFAIFIDKETYQKDADAVEAYKNAVEDDGLSTYIVVDDWKKPEDVKGQIVKLYKSNVGLEGVVFIGDIPIAMIHHAQHLTSAFKIEEEKTAMFKASVASDRFYDDLELKFNFIKQDSIHKLLFYYDLATDSPQRIEKTLYSGRIKPSGTNINKYEVIKKYLLRVAAEKKKQNIIKNAFVFTGHGYFGESLAAWGDEKLSLLEQFPQLFMPGGRIKNIQFSMADEMKENLLAELQKKDLDMALFHAHGDTDLQLLVANPRDGDAAQSIELVKSYLRSKLRSAQDRKRSIAETKESFMKQLGVPESWFDGAFVDSVIAKDSIIAYKLDMHIDDIRNSSPQAKFVMFDECFNGSFHLDEYMAGEYVFGSGNVIAAEANSVNSLQDKWADEHLGLLNKGVRIGQWHKLKNLLESQIIGDPTYRFGTDSKLDLNSMLTFNKNNADKWKSLLKDESPVIRELAIQMIYRSSKSNYESELVKIYLQDPSWNVRLRALKDLAEIDGKAFRDILKKSIDDPYELIRRFSSIWMGEVGDNQYLPYLIDRIMNDESSRVAFNAKNSLSFFDSKESISTLEKMKDDFPPLASRENIKKQIKASINYTEHNLLEESISICENDTLKASKRVNEIKHYRNYKYQAAVPVLIKLMENTATDIKVRTAAAEVLGWFNFSIQKDKILSSCDKVLSNKKEPLILKDEILKTKSRFAQGCNDVTLP